jgi:hypothetical protein
MEIGYDQFFSSWSWNVTSFWCDCSFDARYRSDDSFPRRGSVLGRRFDNVSDEEHVSPSEMRVL